MRLAWSGLVGEAASTACHLARNGRPSPVLADWEGSRPCRAAKDIAQSVVLTSPLAAAASCRIAGHSEADREPRSSQSTSGANTLDDCLWHPIPGCTPRVDSETYST
jgi:hypothetical protein